MFREFGPAPLCLDLDLSSYEGPSQHVWRFRNGSGWLLIAEATIQSRYELVRHKIVVACDGYEQAIPSFQALHLTECNWSNPTECIEEPPEILDDLLCEEEGALIVRWHRERNAALAENYDRQLARIATLEGKAKAFVRRNDARISDLRRRRRRPDASDEEKALLTALIAELEADSDAVIVEMAETRAAVRRRANDEEERLWSRADLLIEVEPLHLFRWHASPMRDPSTYTVRRSHPAYYASTNLSVDVQSSPRWALRLAMARAHCATKSKPAPVPTVIEAPVVITPTQPDPEIGVAVEVPPLEPIDGINPSWSPDRIAVLRKFWWEGVPAKDIALRLGGVTRNRVIGKAYRIGLPKRDTKAEAELRVMANGPRDVRRTASETEPESPWTMEKVDLLEALWRRGLSAQMIANLIGGTSRNAVIGKAKRLGLPMREPLAPSSADSTSKGFA